MTLHEPVVVLGLVIGGALALAGLFRPFLGLLVFIAIHFIQPGDLVPALSETHLERIYGVALLLAFLVYRTSRPGPSLVSNRIVFAGLFLVGAACMSVPFAVWRGGAFWQTVELTKDVTIILLIAGLVDTNDRMRKFLWLMVGLLGWFAASGLISYLHGKISFQEGIERAVGVNSIAGGPNELAGLILTLLPFLIVLLGRTRSTLVRLLLLATGVLGLATMALTGSRISMLGLIAVAACYALRSRHRVPALALGAVVLLTLWFAMPEQYKQRYLTVVDYAQGGQLDASNETRLSVWKEGWRMFLEHPILGVGAGQFPNAYGMVYSGRSRGTWFYAHSLLLQVACEMGVVGLIVFGYFVAQIVKEIGAVPHGEGDSKVELNYQVAVACGMMLLGLLIISMVGHSLYRPYWYLLGGLVAANRHIVDTTLGEEPATVPADQTKENEEHERREAPVALIEEGRR